ncbi:MAG TPA: ATP-binding protein [Egibacteraceae bacterium]|nr:ATP-binding protein [Egibacteraceae bacterium]
MKDARGIADAWSRVVAHLDIQIPAERLEAAAAALGGDPAAAWAEARRQLVAHGAPAHVVRRALFALFGVVTDRDPAVAEQAAPALALLAGAPSLATATRSRTPDLLERVHDGPLQDAIALQLKVRQDPALGELHRAIAGLVSSLRSVLSEGVTRQDVALEAQLAAAVRRCPWAHVTVECTVPEGLNDEIADLVLRVVQESLANLRHADARNAHVQVRAGAEWLRVKVEDDGAGFDARVALTPRPGHLGLPWLSDAIASCGGQLMVRSAHGLGTRVMADLPLSVRQDAQIPMAHSLTA